MRGEAAGSLVHMIDGFEARLASMVLILLLLPSTARDARVCHDYRSKLEARVVVDLIVDLRMDITKERKEETSKSTLCTDCASA